MIAGGLWDCISSIAVQLFPPKPTLMWLFNTMKTRDEAQSSISGLPLDLNQPRKISCVAICIKSMILQNFLICSTIWHGSFDVLLTFLSLDFVFLFTYKSHQDCYPQSQYKLKGCLTLSCSNKPIRWWVFGRRCSSEPSWSPPFWTSMSF